MALLDSSNSWNLLCKKVFGRENCPSQLDNTGRKIAERCRGLPLHIIVIAGMLCQVEKTEKEWMSMEENLKSVSSNESIDILGLSYKNLPPHLKACFLYMGSFPEDYEIPAKKLVLWWIAEGFVKVKGDNTPMEVADHYLENLMHRNLISASGRKLNKQIATCKMHDLLRDLCLREAGKDEFINVVTEYKKAPLFITSNSRRIALQWDVCDDDDDWQTMSLRLTRTIVCTYGHSQLDGLRMLGRFQLIRMLDLRSIFVKCDLFVKVIENLLLLKYLAWENIFSLGSSGTNVIPESIWDRIDLETLIIKTCKVTCESPKFWGRTSLRHVDCRYTFFLCPPPEQVNGSNIWALEDLKILKGIDMSCCTEDVFKRTPNLKKLRIDHKCSTNIFSACCHKETFFNSLRNLNKVETLKLNLCSFSFSKVPCLPSPDVFPPKLTKLNLLGGQLPWEDMGTLGMLPNLEWLQLAFDAFVGDEWMPRAGGFPKLKYLVLIDINLKHWRESDQSSFPNLECLILRFCERLITIPICIGDIETLQQIVVRGCKHSVEVSAKKILHDQLKFGNQGLEVIINQKAVNIDEIEEDEDDEEDYEREEGDQGEENQIEDEYEEGD